MISVSKKAVVSMLLVISMIVTAAVPAYAAYENDQYMQLVRTLQPDGSTVQVGSEQDLTYSLSGSRFTLDPSQIDSKYLLPTNIVLTLDVSGSMSTRIDGTLTRLDVLKESALNFVNNFVGTNTNIALVAYDTYSASSTTLRSMKSATDVNSLRTFINGLVVRGNTNIGDGMRRAYWLLKNAPQNSIKYAVVMTDGEPNYFTAARAVPSSQYATVPFKLDDGPAQYNYAPPTTARPIEYAKTIGGMLAVDNIKSYFIGLTSTFSSPLEEIAKAANVPIAEGTRHYYQVTTSSQVDAVYNNIILNAIASKLPLNVTFDDTMPAGVSVASVPAGFSTSVLADGRVRVTGTITDIALQLDEATGTYSITPWSGTIRVKFNSKGSTSFTDAAISYVDPFGNTKQAEIVNDLSVDVVDTTAPSVPALLLVSNGGEDVELAWTAAADNDQVAGYNVYRDGALLGSTADTSYHDSGLAQNTAYYYEVTAFDREDNESGKSNRIDVVTPDIDAPTAPADVAVTGNKSSSIALSWSASSDNIGVAGYKVYRDGSLIAETDELTFTDTGLIGGQTYAYTVTAVDDADNESGNSGAVTVTTNRMPIASGGGNLVVEAASTSGAVVTLDGSATVDADGDALTFEWTGEFGSADGVQPAVQLPIGSHEITLTVRDGEFESKAVVHVDVVDTTAPSVPANAQLVDATSVTAAISWSASSDAVGVTGYNVYRDGVRISTASGLEFQDSGLISGQAYAYAITAVDAAGNESAPSDTVTVITNRAPVAGTSGDAVVEATSADGAMVMLDGSATTDADGDTLTYNWSGSFGTTAGMTASVPLPLGGHDITLTVSDGELSSVAAVHIDVVDTTAPSAPANAMLNSKTSSSASLSWSSSSDWVGIAGYRVYRDGSLVATIMETSYNDTQLTTGNTYRYVISAVDAAGNESAVSNTVTVRTNSAPASAAGEDQIVEATSAQGAVVTFNGSGTTDADQDALSYTWSGSFGTLDGITTGVLLPIGQHEVTLTVTDGELEAVDTVLIEVVDTTAPSAPSALQAKSPNAYTAQLTWPASSDAVGVTGYNVFRDNALIAAVTDTRFEDTGLAPGTTYTYSVSAVDAAGNESSLSSQAQIVTNSAPTAAAGDDRIVEASSADGAIVVLDGSASADPDLDSLTYVWTGESGTYEGASPSIQLPIGTHSFTLRVSDGEFESTDDVQIQVVDTTAPNEPAQLQQVSKTSTSAVVSWSAASDIVGVAGYKIYRNGEYVTTVTELGFTDTGLTKGDAYAYTVTAIDAAGNESKPSGEAIVVPNSAPVAEAGDDAVLEAVSPEGASITLVGTASADPDGDNLTYVWSGDFGTMEGASADVMLPLGLHAITLTVSDGEFTSTDTFSVKVVDTTPPVIAGQNQSDPNAEGWYNKDVTIHWEASDSASGIASVTPDMVLSNDGAGQSAVGTAIDTAGNSATATVSGIHIDKTAPTVSDTTIGSHPYTTNDTIVVNFEAIDTLSGLASVSATLNEAPVTNGQTIALKSKEGSNVLTIKAADKAGNVTVKTVNFQVSVAARISVLPGVLLPDIRDIDNAVTVLIELPNGYNVDAIDLSTVRLAYNGVSITAKPFINSVGNRFMMVKFNRQSLIQALAGQTGPVQLTVSGGMTGGSFIGKDVIQVLSKNHK